jgi:RNA polymerase primary sigma factor
MMVNPKETKASSKNRKHAPAKPLWYAPDRRLASRQAAEQAVRLCEWMAHGTGLAQKPDEEMLFVGMHTCAYRAGRRECTSRQRREWTRRWEMIRDYIVQHNLGLVYSMLGRFSTRRSDEDDLLSDALLALTRATDRFNPWRGYRFSTYACNVIARAIMRRGKRESHYRKLFPVQHDVLFERPADTADTDTDLYVERLRYAMDNNIGALTTMEAHVLAQRFTHARGTKLTFQEIGDAIGLSKERVRQIQNVALEKLRGVLAEDPVLR